MAQARAVDPAADEYGHARSRAYTDAVALLKASAKLGHTLAELRGSKFEHTINVRRENTNARSDSDGDEVYDTNWMWLDDETLYDWKKKQRYKLEMSDPAAAADTDVGAPISQGAMAEGAVVAISGDSNGNPEKGDPPPISRGSNGNFASRVVGEPRVRSL